MPGIGYDLGLTLVQFGIQYIVFDLAQGKHTAQQFRNFHRSGTYQDGTAFIGEAYHLFDHRGVFFPFGLVDTVILVVANNGFIGRDHHHVEFIDIPEFARFGFCRTGHTGQLAVHPEKVLQSNSGKGLGGCFHFYPLFRFDRLVQAVGVPASFHHTAGLFIHDLHFVIDHHILIIFFEQGIRFQQLVDSMHTFRLHGIVLQQFVFPGRFLILRKFSILQFRHFGPDIGQDKEIRIVRLPGQEINPFICQLYAVLLFIDHKIEGISHNMHITHLLLHIKSFDLKHCRPYSLLTEEFDKRFIFRHPFIGTEKQ